MSSRSSRSAKSGAATSAPVTAPLVPRDHALGTPPSRAYPGSTSASSNRCTDHARPKRPHGSSRGLAAPHDASVRTAQSAALRCPGEPVRRGPLTSVSQNR
jgi:hypothetical protein